MRIFIGNMVLHSNHPGEAYYALDGQMVAFIGGIALSYKSRKLRRQHGGSIGMIADC